MQKGIIYIYTSPSGKQYVGQTIDEEGRKWDHKNQTIKIKSKFANAIKKYGLDNFKYEILFKCNSKSKARLKIILNNMEKYFIKKYNTYEFGYNCTKGGDGNLGRICSEETKIKISIANKGKKRSIESKLKMSISQIGKSCKSVLQFSKDGIFIKEYNSIKDANNELNISSGSISRCCLGKAKTVAGYIWKYKD